MNRLFLFLVVSFLTASYSVAENLDCSISESGLIQCSDSELTCVALSEPEDIVCDDVTVQCQVDQDNQLSCHRKPLFSLLKTPGLHIQEAKLYGVDLAKIEEMGNFIDYWNCEENIGPMSSDMSCHLKGRSGLRILNVDAHTGIVEFGLSKYPSPIVFALGAYRGMGPKRPKAVTEPSAKFSANCQVDQVQLGPIERRANSSMICGGSKIGYDGLTLGFTIELPNLF